MSRALVLIVGFLVVSACKPGRCLRHSDCPTAATCSSGVCRMPPKQSKSRAQPASEGAQSSARTESAVEGDDTLERTDAGMVTASSSQDTLLGSGGDAGSPDLRDASDTMGRLDGSAFDAAADAYAGDAWVGDGALGDADAAQ